MKRRIIIFTVSIFALIIVLCGCEKSVEDLDITIDEMSFTLPDGEWYYGDGDGELENQYVGENSTLTILHTDSSDYENYDRTVSFDFYPYEDMYDWIPPDYSFMYIDGYVAEFNSWDNGFDVMIETEDGYYLIDSDYTGDKSSAKEETKELLSSISFEQSGNRPDLAMTYDVVNTDIKPDIGSEEWDVVVQGIVEAVDHDTSGGNNTTYIDIGAVYPDRSRVTGVIWEEYQNEFDSYDLDGLKGKEILMCGKCYLYDGSISVRIENDSQIVPIYEIEDL